MKIIQRFLLVIAGCFLGLVVLEVAYSIADFVAGENPAIVTYADGEMGWKFNLKQTFKVSRFGPTQSTNYYGFLDDEFELKTPQRPYTVAALGDSYTVAISLDHRDRFDTLIEEKFKKEGRPIVIYNFGVMGLSTTQEWFCYQKKALPLKPDAVVLLTDLGTDLLDNVNWSAYSDQALDIDSHGHLFHPKNIYHPSWLMKSFSRTGMTRSYTTSVSPPTGPAVTEINPTQAIPPSVAMPVSDVSQPRRTGKEAISAPAAPMLTPTPQQLTEMNNAPVVPSHESRSKKILECSSLYRHLRQAIKKYCLA